MSKEKPSVPPLYAHSKKGTDDRSEWQRLPDHLTETASMAAGRVQANGEELPADGDNNRFAACFDSAPWEFAAGMLHDLGKAAPEFQTYLIESANDDGDQTRHRCSVNHSEAGAAWAESNLGPFLGRTLAYLIAGHHAGLPDYEGDGNASLRIRLASGKKNLAAIQDRIGPFVEKIDPSSLTPPKTFSMTERNYHLWVRMLFSCLIDADRLNTEAFDSPEKAALRPKFPSIIELKEKFDAAMIDFVKLDAEAETDAAKILNQARNEVRAACIEAGRAVDGGTGGDTVNRHGGIYSLTVPTGGGKTLSSMAFALEHAVHHHKRRIIYVIPYTSIIEQTANLFRKIFGGGNVVEHHSNFDAEKYELHRKKEAEERNAELDPVSADALELAAENWDAPIIITTNVQFFESLFAAKTKRCRKLHHIVDSVVILDEAQMLKPELLHPCVDVMNQLAESFGVSLVVCTATQPTLDRLDRIKPNYSNLAAPRPIIPEDVETRLYNDLTRVEYRFDPPDRRRTWEELAAELADYNEVLCVVNTRRDCYDLYQALRRLKPNVPKKYDDSGEAPLPETVHLSALMCGEHRSLVIEKIKKRLETNRKNAAQGKPITPIRVVSTQLVEAGVDIDFPVVYRALAGLDSVTQAAGRCNREGLLGRAGGKVVVFNPPNNNVPSMITTGITATNCVLAEYRKDVDALNKMINSSECFKKFFEQFYALTDLDVRIIPNQMTVTEALIPDRCLFKKSLFVSKCWGRISSEKKKNACDSYGIKIKFRSVGENFRLIDDLYTTPVIVSYQNDELDNSNSSQCGDNLVQRLRKMSSFRPERKMLRQLQRFTVNLPKKMVEIMVKKNYLRVLPTGIVIQELTGLYQNDIGFNLYGDQLPAELFLQK